MPRLYRCLCMKSIVAILDWGLGHASRCIPLIRRLVGEGDEVLVVSSGSALALVKAECPDVATHTLPAYNVRYPSQNMIWNMLRQGPRIFYTVWKEQQLIDTLVADFKPDRIISDGRFGCYKPGIENIWLAHQLQIQHPWSWIQQMANTLYHAYIQRRFQAVWIPDYAEVTQRLSGNLASPVSQLPATYLGPLSRYQHTSQQHKSTRYEWLFLLSGPEPQRSRLEKQLRDLALQLREPVLLVRGVTGSNKRDKVNTQLTTVDWLHGTELAQAVAQSKRILCRSGYSTLMDLHYWQKQALLIPTPGQTEQEYLAQHWAIRGWARTITQDKLDIAIFH